VEEKRATKKGLGGKTKALKRVHCRTQTQKKDDNGKKEVAVYGVESEVNAFLKGWQKGKPARGGASFSTPNKRGKTTRGGASDP